MEGLRIKSELSLNYHISLFSEGIQEKHFDFIVTFKDSLDYDNTTFGDLAREVVKSLTYEESHYYFDSIAITTTDMRKQGKYFFFDIDNILYEEKYYYDEEEGKKPIFLTDEELILNNIIKVY